VHENPQNVLIIGGELLPQEATKIGKNITEIKEISTLSDIKNQKFDIVISFFDSIVYQDLVPYLHKDAILSCKAKSNEIKKEADKNRRREMAKLISAVNPVKSIWGV
jgi:spermidine synthase